MAQVCGRYVASTPTAVLADVFDVDETLIDEDEPSFNVAPTDPVPAIAVNRAGQRTLRRMRWGLVPSWSTDAQGAARMINARVETVLTARAFRAAFERRRCLVPADGFYEWLRHDSGGKPTKQAWFIANADGSVMAMAGIWEVWRPHPEADLVRTCSILTTTPDDVMRPIHDRMPVILPPDAWEDWLAKDTPPDVAMAMTAATPTLTRHPVGPAVNSVKNNGPDLIVPVPEAPDPPVALRLL